MKKFFVFLLIVICVVLAIRYQGLRIPEVQGPEVMSGVNLGGWLADELNFGKKRFDCDAPGIHELLRQRFSVAEADETLGIYHDTFLKAEDFTLIKTMGFNSVRLPVSASHLYDTQGSAARFDQTSKRIAWVLEMAETNGLSVVLNIRVRAGEWAAQPSVNGRRFAARWSDRDVQSVAVLWSRLAERFKNSTALSAYDLSPGSCQVDADWAVAFTEWTKAIASKDTTRIIYAPWPRPAQTQFDENALFEEIKPGFSTELLGQSIHSDDPVQETRTILDQDLQRMDQYWTGAGVPCLAAEYNPAMLDASNPDNIRTFMSAASRFGWASMLWTFKSIETGSTDDERFLSVVSGRSVMESPDFTQSSREEIQNYFRSLEQINYSVPPQLKEVLAKPHVMEHKKNNEASIALSESILSQNNWELSNIGEVECFVRNEHTNQFVVSASGLGVGGFADEFGFLSRAPAGNFVMSGIVSKLESSSKSAGAGLMVRQSDDDHSPYLVVYKSPDGKIHSIVNHADGQPLLRRTLVKKSGSDHLRIMTDGIVLKASCSPDGESWPVAANFTIPWLTNQIIAGAIVFSGHEYRSATAVFNELIVEP